MARTFRDALIAAAAQPGMTLRQIATGSGVSYHQLRKLVQREGATTNIEDARAVAAFLGLTLDEMLGDNLAEDRAAIVEQYNRLSDAERLLLRELAEARSARDRQEG